MAYSRPSEKLGIKLQYVTLLCLPQRAGPTHSATQEKPTPTSHPHVPLLANFADSRESHNLALTDV